MTWVAALSPCLLRHPPQAAERADMGQDHPRRPPGGGARRLAQQAGRPGFGRGRAWPENHTRGRAIPGVS